MRSIGYLSILKDGHVEIQTNELSGNVLSAKAPDEKIPFIAESDLALYQKYRDAAFEVQVGLHELTGMMTSNVPGGESTRLTIHSGHGCGKLLQETSPGVFNFDVKNPPVSPVTGKPIATWYKPGQTWGSVFGGLAGAYEVWFSSMILA